MSKNSSGEKLRENVTKLLLGGASGLTLAVVFNNDLPPALRVLGGISTSVLALFGAFGEGLTTHLKAWSTVMGDKLGHRITGAADETLENWVSRVGKKYLEALRTYCLHLEVEGLRGDLPPLALKDVFVPLRLDSDPSDFTRSSSIKSIWELLPTKNQDVDSSPYQRMAIIAEPGYGKTTLTRHLTLEYTNTEAKDTIGSLLPVLIILRKVYERIQDVRTPTLPDLIQQEVKKLPRCQDLEVSADWFDNRLTKGQCLVMFDGLDEVAETRRDIVSQWINWQMQAYPSQFILTSRPHGYTPHLFKGVSFIKIIDFNADQKEEFIHKWYKAILWHQKWEPQFLKSRFSNQSFQLSSEQINAQIEIEAEDAASHLMKQIIETPSLNDLAKNPLLITIIATTHRVFSSLPHRRVEIYKKMFGLLLEDRPNVRKTNLTLPTMEDNQKVLQKLSFALMLKGKTEFSTRQVHDFLQRLLLAYEPDIKLSPERFLEEIQTISGLMIGGASDLYQFGHKTFIEYLTAVELKERNQPELLIKKIYDHSWEDWQEVIRFYASMTNATPFIEAILRSYYSKQVESNKKVFQLAYNIVIEDKARLDIHVRQQLNQVLKSVHVGGDLNARWRLQGQFQTRIPIGSDALISSEYITWGEYQLFMRDQQSRQFHSKAETDDMASRLLTTPELDISWQDAQWFCAWLATFTYLKPEDSGVYYYRLPTIQELEKVRSPGASTRLLMPLTNSSNNPGNALRVVRQRISDCYSSLLSNLANGRWKQADQETCSIILKLVECDRHFTPEAVKRLPRKDLELLNHLWEMFSGGRFGFGVQKFLWKEAGGLFDFGQYEPSASKTYRKMSEKNAWRIRGRQANYSELNFTIDAPKGHLPTLYRSASIPGTQMGKAWIQWCALLSQLSYYEI